MNGSLPVSLPVEDVEREWRSHSADAKKFFDQARAFRAVGDEVNADRCEAEGHASIDISRAYRELMPKERLEEIDAERLPRCRMH